MPRTNRLLLLALAPALCAGAALHISRVRAQSSWPSQITNVDAPARVEAIAQARRIGPSALSQIIRAHKDEIQAHLQASAVASPSSAAWTRLRESIDAVSGQRDGWASGLFWFSNLDEARAVARREKKPILLLRMLGRLDAELSCANSRFFRTALYPDPRINSILRDKFVLAWSSERPVPVVSVDMGDGRVLKRTLTGNSAHYILDSDGRPLDVMPGMVAPAFFARWLGSSQVLAADWSAQRGKAGADAWLRAWHQKALEEASESFARGQVQVKLGGAAPDAMRRQREEFVRRAQFEPTSGAPLSPSGQAFPRANEAGALAMSKRVVEGPVLAQGFGMPIGFGFGDPMAALFGQDARLSTPALSLMGRKSPALAAQLLAAAPPAPMMQQAQVQRVARSSSPSNSSFKRSDGRLPEPSMREAFELSVAQDTALNEWTHHARIHAWMSRASFSFPTLNARLYSAIFQTPRADPWLGLAPADAFSALDNDGVTVTSNAPKPEPGLTADGGTGY